MEYKYILSTHLDEEKSAKIQMSIKSVQYLDSIRNEFIGRTITVLRVHITLDTKKSLKSENCFMHASYTQELMVVYCWKYWYGYQNVLISTLWASVPMITHWVIV